LSYDLFDTGMGIGRPLWLRLPQVPFLEDEPREAEPTLGFAFDPDPLGPPQTLRPIQQAARSLLDPSPFGPLAGLFGPPAGVVPAAPAVAMGPPAPAEPARADVPQPENTGSVVLKRRY
jgi:hypothetical protein